MRGFHGSFSGYEPNHLFINQGNGERFLEAGSVFGLGQRTDGRAVAALDIDGDGMQDLVVQSLQDLRVYRNLLPRQNSFIQLDLLDDRGRPALGAEVTVRVGGRSISDRVRLLAGFHTQVSPRLHIGVGKATRIQSIEVKWRSGRRSSFQDVPVDTLFEVREGRATPLKKEILGWTLADRPTPPRPMDWKTQYRSTKGTVLPLLKEDTISIVNLWAPWCEACKTETPELARFLSSHSDAVHLSGLVVLPRDEKSVTDFIERFGVAYPQFIASESMAKALFPDQGEVRLPQTIIFDQRGQVVRHFTRAVTENELEEIVSALSIDVTLSDYLSQAEIDLQLGEYTEALIHLKKAAQLAPARADILQELVQAAERSGHPEDALVAHRSLVKLDPGNVSKWRSLIELLGRLKGWGEAVSELPSQLETAPFLTLKVRTLRRAGRDAAARTILQDALEQFPDDPDLIRLQKRLNGHRRHPD